MGCVIQGWGGVGHVGVGWVGHVDVGWGMSCRVGGVGWGVSCRDGVEWVM